MQNGVPPHMQRPMLKRGGSNAQLESKDLSAAKDNKPLRKSDSVAGVDLIKSPPQPLSPPSHPVSSPPSPALSGSGSKGGGLFSKIGDKKKRSFLQFGSSKKEDLESPLDITTIPTIPHLNGSKTDAELINESGDVSYSGTRSRSRSVSEVGLRNAPDELVFNLDVDEAWEIIDKNWSEWSKKKADLARILYKKGVPEKKIGDIWVKISKLIPGTQYLSCPYEGAPPSGHECLYHQLLEISSPCEPQIMADIHRTFPDQEVAYTEKFQKSLFNVLKAFSLYDDAVGYCQGLSFVAALLLMKVQEEQAFYILVRLMKGHDLRSFYTEDMRGVQLRMFQMTSLIQSLFFDLHQHLEELEVKASMFLIPWFMTAFAYQLPLSIAYWVMNLLLLEGIPAFFRVALSLLLMCEPDLKELDEQGIMEYFRKDMRKEGKFSQPAALRKFACEVNLSIPQLQRMEQEFLANEKKASPSISSVLSSPVPASDKKVRLNVLLRDNHELREQNRQQAAELATLQANYEAYKKKMEAEKVAMLQRLSIVSESLKTALAEKKEMKEKMGRLEKDMDNMQLNITELMKCNVALSEEIRDLRGRPGQLSPASSPSSPTSHGGSNSRPTSPVPQAQSPGTHLKHK